MMVVMTMMEVELHLKNNPKQDRPVCQIRPRRFSFRVFRQGTGFRAAQGAELRDAETIGGYGLGGCVASGRGCGV
jgi:hypothetical protein